MIYRFKDSRFQLLDLDTQAFKDAREVTNNPCIDRILPAYNKTVGECFKIWNDGADSIDNMLHVLDPQKRRPIDSTYGYLAENVVNLLYPSFVFECHTGFSFRLQSRTSTVFSADNNTRTVCNTPIFRTLMWILHRGRLDGLMSTAKVFVYGKEVVFSYQSNGQWLEARRPFNDFINMYRYYFSCYVDIYKGMVIHYDEDHTLVLSYIDHEGTMEGIICDALAPIALMALICGTKIPPSPRGHYFECVDDENIAFVGNNQRFVVPIRKNLTKQLMIHYDVPDLAGIENDVWECVKDSQFNPTLKGEACF